MQVSTLLKSSVIVLAFVCLSPLVNAQPGGTGPDPDPNQGTGAPLDLGISAFIAAGIGYAAKRRYDAKKNEKMMESNTEK